MADDSYAPNFAEYIGKSIAEAMQDENPVSELIAGKNTSFSFSTVETNIAQVQSFAIDGVFQDTEHILWLPTSLQGDEYVATYLGKVICSEDQEGVWSRCYTSSTVQSMINGNVTFGQLLPWAKSGPKVTDFIVDGTRLTLADAISPNDVPQTALQKLGVLPEYVVNYQ